jgi:hypothetical protein
VLGRKGKWLGGEFYAATKEVLEEAWHAAHAAAMNRSGNNHG